MNNKKILIYSTIILIFFGALYFMNFPNYDEFGKSVDHKSQINNDIKDLKKSTIPTNYYQYLDLDKTYIYNVSYWESGAIISYYDYNWADQGDINASNGGQIYVNFTGFYDKHPSDDNVFANPVPYINMTVYQNYSNLLIWNATFSNVSSSEAGYVLGISYNTFRAGFLIPISQMNWLIQQAEAQDTPDSAACTVNVEEYYDEIKIEFLQDSTWQNTSLIYDKKSGVLVWAKVQTVSFFGSADFIIQLNGYEIKLRPLNLIDNDDDDDDKKKQQQIPSFPMIIIVTMIMITTIMIILKIRYKLE